MKVKLTDILGIISWGLIIAIFLLFVLKIAGIIHSPSFEELLLSAILSELIRLELELREVKIKTELLWKDFKNRKKI